MMKNLFVFTASSGAPKAHLEISIKNPYSDEPFEKYLQDHDQGLFRAHALLQWGELRWLYVGLLLFKT